MNSEALKEARESAGYTRQKVAELLGVTPPTYARMELNPSYIQARFIPDLCKLFKLNLSDFF